MIRIMISIDGTLLQVLFSFHFAKTNKNDKNLNLLNNFLGLKGKVAEPELDPDPSLGILPS